MIELLEQYDQSLFLFLNGLRADFLDKPMWVISQEYGNAPVFIVLIAYLWRKQGWQLALSSLLGVVLVVALSDRISVELFKEVFMRYRPTHNLDLKDVVHTVTDFSGKEYRGGLYSFVSSHATNFLALATFYWMLLRPDRKRVFWIIFGWAILVCYSRIYLGVHYPTDIVCGGLLGIAIGLFSFKVFIWLYEQARKRRKPMIAKS